MEVLLVKNSLIKEKIKNLHLHFSHPSYFYEKQLLQQIKLGLLDEALKTLDQINSLERSILSNNSIRSIKNSLICSCTLFTRTAIEAGVTYEDAFDLSDVLIKHIENLNKEKELKQFEYNMAEYFIELISKKRITEYPYPISKIINFIHVNPCSKLSVDKLAKIVNISPDYLSSRFRKVVGVPLSEYIQNQKILHAKNFIEFSELSITEISTLLEYCNPAYFTNVFKKYTGLTPSAYKKLSPQKKD